MDASIWVATASGLMEWKAGQRRIHFEGSSVTSLNGGTDDLWAVTEEHFVWREVDGGWEETASVDQRIRCVLPSNGYLLAGTDNAHLLRIERAGAAIVDSFEDAPGRDDWYTPWGGPPDVRSLARGPSGELFVNVHVGGILRSTDGGESWSPTLDIHSDVHEVHVTEDRVLAACGWGLASAHIEDPTSWEFHDEGLHATYARAIVGCGEWVLMTASDGPRGGHAAVYRRSLQGGRFEKCTRGLPEWFEANIDTGCLAATGATAVFGTREGSLFISEDEGASWSILEDGLPEVRSVEVESP